MNASAIRDFLCNFFPCQDPQYEYAPIQYDYAYIGPAKHGLAWFDVFFLAFCVFALAVVVHGVITRARNK